jgi:hypothetical protein
MTVEPIEATTGRAGWAARFVAVASLAAVWALLRPYAGIIHDSRIYVGRALADLSPHTIGLEYAFLHDGQSRFSLFPKAFAQLVSALGPGPAAQLLSGLGLVLWVAGAAWLFSRFLKGAGLWGALICLAALPAGYGGHDVFSWAEAFATPRIFAEAASLAALGMILDARRGAAGALFVVALVLHPLVAAPAVAVGVACLGMTDRRWWLLFPLGLLAAVGAALAGLPVASRLFQAPDPQWLAVLQHRSPYLFPARWPADSWALAICQATTLALTWRGAPASLRRLIAAAALAAVAGVLTTAFAPSLLVIQVQPWRAAWLGSLLAAGLFALCGAALWRGGPAARAALAALATAWVGHASLPMATLGCGLALLLAFAPRARTLPPWALRLTWPYFFAITAGMWVIEIWHLLRAGSGLPLEAWLSAPAVSSTIAVRAGLVALAVRFTLASPPARLGGRLPLFAAAATAAAIAAGLCWDARPAFVRIAESQAQAPPLARALAGGSVLWLGDFGSSWLVTGAPEWWSIRQGAGGLFNRQLALEWRRRFGVLAGAGLIRKDIDFAAAGGLAGEPTVRASALRDVCGSQDGPAWIVAPVERVEPASLARAVAVWRPAVRDIVAAASGGRLVRVSAYAIFSCSRPAAGPAALDLHSLQARKSRRVSVEFPTS